MPKRPYHPCPPRRAATTRPSEQSVPVSGVAEAHEHGLAGTDARRPQIAGRAEHRVDHVFPRLSARCELRDLGTLRDDHSGSGFRQSGRILCPELFARGNDFFGFDLVVVQKLGRAYAGRSTVAVVVPVDLLGHHPALLSTFRTLTGSSNPCTARRPAGSKRRLSSGEAAATSGVAKTSPRTASSAKRAARFTTGPQ